MIQIKRFIDKVSIVEGKQQKDFVMTIGDARGLRDELAKLLADLHLTTKSPPEPIIKIDMKGGAFK